jgi:hypothetical protein
VTGGCSGVAFSQSPDNTGCAMIEAVWGLNQGLVDGTVEPDRWQVELDSGSVLSHATPQRREALGGGQVGVKRVRLAHKQSARPPLDEQGVLQVLEAVQAAERLFGRPQDMEWTMAGKELYVLQSRPITTVGGDERSWYLSLHRSFGNLQLLRRTIEYVLLPAMVADAESLAKVNLAALSDRALETEIKTRQDLLSSWEQRYRDYCIPMAHGVRLFGQVYNDRLEPQDPFQFIGLLAATNMMALERNKRLEEMAGMLRNEPELAVQLRQGTITAANNLGSLMAEFVECARL